MSIFTKKTANSFGALTLPIIIGCLSSFYLVQNKYLAIVIVLIPLLLAFFSYAFPSKMGKLEVYLLLYLVVIAFTQLIVLQNIESLSFVFTIFSFFVFLMVYKNRNKNELLTISKFVLIFVIAIGIVDTIYRFRNPVSGLYYTGIHFFYQFKGRGLLYIDTNNTGMLMLSSICFYHYLKSKNLIKNRVIYLFLLSLLVLTFSRACYIGYIFFLLVFSKKIPTIVKVLVGTFAFIYVLLNLNSLGTDDISFQSKLSFYDTAVTYFRTESITNQLIGIGMSNSIQTFGIYTHSWPFTYSIEAGWIAFAMTICLFVAIIRQTKRALFIIAPYLLAGLSFYPVFNPYFYCFIAIIIYIEKDFKKAKTLSRSLR